MPSDTAKRLIEAVLLSIREHGYAGTSMQDLLRETGVSSSSMYHFFPGGKEELVASAVRRSGAWSTRRIVRVLDEDDPAEAIARIFDWSATEMVSNDFALGCPIGVPAAEAPSDSAAIREAVAETFEAWAAEYSAALRKAGIDAERATMLGRFIVSAYEGSVTLARATRSTEPYEDAKTVIYAQLAG